MSIMRYQVRIVSLLTILVSLLYLTISPAHGVRASPLGSSDGPASPLLAAGLPWSIRTDVPDAAGSPLDVTRAPMGYRGDDDREEGSVLERRGLVKRGNCMSTNEQGEYDDCDGTMPTTAEIGQMIIKHNRLPGRASVFYTNLDGKIGLDQAKAWLACHPDVVPADGYVMFDGIVNSKWLDAKGLAIGKVQGNVGLDTFLKLVSQAFAEQTVGTTYVFTPHDQNPLDIMTSSGVPTAWRGWEYPALTRNPRVISIVSIDPRPHVAEDDPNKRRVIWTPVNGPSPNPPLGTNRHGPSP